MIAKWVDIDGAWRVVIFYDVTDSDAAWVAERFGDAGAMESDCDNLFELFSYPNRAAMISDRDQKMSVVAIGWATDKMQRINSVIHEIDHVQRDICDYYNVPLGSERAAYLQGKLAQELIILES